MVLRFDVKRKMTARSDRVKSVEIHPTEPWVLAALYTGTVLIWDYNTGDLVKSFELSPNQPVRNAKFIVRKQWFIAASDDMRLRVYNYNTKERIHAWEAHQDYIRCLAVHPTQPYVLSASDDMSVKLWDWQRGWQCQQIFEGHSHYVMQVVFNPKDSNTFATASLDHTIKIWGLGSPEAHFTLEGHERGVNCVDYFPGGEKPYLISGSDDNQVRVWDYQNKSCVQVLEGHTHNVSCVAFHPTLPILISGSEDGTLMIYHANTYRLEKTLHYAMDRVWSLAYLKASNRIAVGFDMGTVMIKFGSEEPSVSMSRDGKIVWAVNNEVQTVNVKTLQKADKVDGERLPLAVKDLGSCEVFAQSLQHNYNGRFVVVCGDGEYIIYTALAWRNKAFGSGIEFVWANEGKGDYGVRVSKHEVKTYVNFEESGVLRPDFSAEAIFGGTLLTVRGSDFLCFYDWEHRLLIRKIDVNAKSVYWASTGTMCALATEDSCYILRYNASVVEQCIERNGVGEPLPENELENAFEVLHEMPEKVRAGHWVGEVFIYINSSQHLKYAVGGHAVTVSHLDKPMFLLGYLPKDNRAYLIDKSLNVISYTIQLSVISFQTAILRGDEETARSLLTKIDKSEMEKVSTFLEEQGHKELALEVSTDLDHRFDLAVQLNRLDVAHELARESGHDLKWKQLGDMALAASKLGLAEDCLKSAEDHAGLLLLYTAQGDANGCKELLERAIENGEYNVAFIAAMALRQLDTCIDILLRARRLPEAALFARTYRPSRVSEVVGVWKTDLAKSNSKAAEALADPSEYPNLFPDMEWALKAEQAFNKFGARAVQYLDQIPEPDLDLIEAIKAIDSPAAVEPPAPEPEPESEPAASLIDLGGAPASPTPEPTPSPAPEHELVVEATPEPTPEVDSTPVIAPTEDEPLPLDGEADDVDLDDEAVMRELNASLQELGDDGGIDDWQ